ncbi:hypothetical protein [Microbacterium sp. YY-01]|uniref:hypothetical protein n=1 Tax=Microbacterium sp. YY-01 TaxID=3421634 RepID=UPI003D186B0B
MTVVPQHPEPTLHLSTVDSGWLLVPALDADSAHAQEWIDQSAQELAAAMPAGWTHDQDQLARLALYRGLESRRERDEYMFLVWPAPAPACVLVHVTLGTLVDDHPLPGPGDGILYHADGLGYGVQIPVAEEHAEGATLGVQFVFVQGREAVVVDVEPTAVSLLSLIVNGLHGMVQSLRVTYADGSEFIADRPQILEAEDNEQWPV